MKKSCAKPRFDDRFCVFLTDNKMWQTLNYYLKSAKKIARQRFYSLNRAWLHKCIRSAWKCAMQTCINESRLRKQICIKLTFILFEEVLKSTELLLSVRMSVSKRLILALQKFSLSNYHKWSLLFASQLVSEKSVGQLKVGIYRLPIVSSMNISRIAVVILQKFLRSGGHNRFAKSVYPRLQTGLRYMWQSARANQSARIRKIVVETDDWSPPKSHLAVGKKSLKGAC